MSLEAGTTLGPYQVVAALGAGGMGEVYEGRDTRLDRRVAIKVLAAALSPNPEARARFEREARAVSQLSHPRICSLYDIGREGEIDYLVMEFLEGETLAERLERGALPLEEALRIAVEILEALVEAHERGLVHRDLKPGNVMLTPTGSKLLDFGLAKTLEGETKPSDDLTAMPTVTTPLTQAGSILGTLHYMSPEQLEGGVADARSDLFSFGAVLQEMVMGKRVFDGPSQASVVAAILKEAPASIAATVPGASPALDRLLRRCLAKRPEDRWQSTADLAHELRAIAEDPSHGVDLEASDGTPRPSSRERFAWLLAGILAIVTLLLTFQLARQPAREPVLPTRFVIRANGGEMMRSAGENAAPVAVSPDGRHLVYGLIEEDGKNRLWLRSLDAVAARPLPGTEEGRRPFWSPDSRSVAFFARGKLMKLDLSGGVALPLADARGGRGGTWAEDGTIVFAPTSGSGLLRVSAEGGEVQSLTTLDVERGEASHRYPHFLPGSQAVVFLTLTREGAMAVGSEAENRLDAVRLEDGQRHTLMVGAANAQYRGGELYFYSGGSLMARRLDVDRLGLVGPTREVVADVKYDAPYERAVFSVTEKVLAYEGGGYRGETELLWVDRQGEVGGRVGSSRLQDSGRISPEGDRIVTLRVAEGESDLWVYDLSTDREQRIALGQNLAGTPHWSPDGERLAYNVVEGSGLQVFVGSAEGGSRTCLCDFPEGNWRLTDWSSDGRFLLFDNDGIWAFDFESPEGAPFEVVAEDSRTLFGRLSPDGRWLVYASYANDRYEIYLTSFPEAQGRWQVTQGGGLEPYWSRDGRSIYFRTYGNQVRQAEIVFSDDTPRIGAVRSLFHAYFEVDEDGSKYDLSPDGKRFLLSVMPEEAAHSPLTVSVSWASEAPDGS